METYMSSGLPLLVLTWQPDFFLGLVMTLTFTLPMYLRDAGLPIRDQNSPGHNDWLRLQHFTQVRPMAALPAQFAIAIGKEILSRVWS